MIFLKKFSSFLFFRFLGGGRGVGKTAKNGLKLPVSVCHALYLRNCRSYHWDFWYTGVKQLYLQVFFFFLKEKKCNIVYIKIILFFIGPLQQFFNKYLFFKFISKCEKEILRCTPPSLHVCDFLSLFYQKVDSNGYYWSEFSQSFMEKFVMGTNIY